MATKTILLCGAYVYDDDFSLLAEKAMFLYHHGEAEQYCSLMKVISEFEFLELELAKKISQEDIILLTYRHEGEIIASIIERCLQLSSFSTYMKSRKRREDNVNELSNSMIELYARGARTIIAPQKWEFSKELSFICGVLGIELIDPQGGKIDTHEDTHFEGRWVINLNYYSSLSEKDKHIASWYDAIYNN